MSARLTVSGAALKANLALLRRSASGAVGAVVKANGYGLGAAWVARVLSQQGVADFFVATLEEGERLRDTLPSAAVVYVLEGLRNDPTAVRRLRQAALTPVLNTVAQCRRWRDQDAPAAVHVDTGMQRLGLTPAEAGELLLGGGLRCRLLLSHFARADEPAVGETREQIRAMTALTAQLPAPIPLSLCNSAGLLRGLGPEALGRAGVALYGANPFDGDDVPLGSGLTPVGCVEAQVLQLRDVPAGVPLGYGGTFTTARPTRIAVLGAGYADGIPRLASNRGWACVEDRELPILGRVSMDMVQVDATETSLAVGDWVQLLGDRVPLAAIAQWAQTIPYEILTGLDAAQRMARQELD